MDNEAGKRKSRKYETNPKARLKATALSMTSTFYAANAGFPTNPFRSDSNPINPRSPIHPTARPSPAESTLPAPESYPIMRVYFRLTAPRGPE
jgi:hypothetical protein